jgi:hypothetical protein
VPSQESTVVLFDVDNTLIDNDRIIDDLSRYLTERLGNKNRDRYFAIFEELRAELGYTDYLGTLQRYRLEDRCDPKVLMMSSFLLDYPFADRLYPGALGAIEHARSWGMTVVLSDGDAVFQPRKVERSGLWGAFEGRVLIFIHKELMLPEVERFYPADRYIMIDDKLRILTAMKKSWGNRLTTVFPRQGRYAIDPGIIASYPRPDLTIESIGDLVDLDLSSPTLCPSTQGA